MSEKTFPHDILKDVTHPCFSLKDNELQRGNEEESSLLLADDALDDSSSSYCTALCSLSDCSEALEDESHMLCAGSQYEAASPEPTVCIDATGGSVIKTPPQLTAPLQQFKEKKDEDVGASQDIRNEDPICRQDEVYSFILDPLLLPSKPFPSNPISIISADVEQDSSQSQNICRKDSLLPTWDNQDIKTSTQIDTKPSKTLSTLQPRLTSGLLQEQQYKLGKVSSVGVSLGTKHLSSPKRKLQNLNIMSNIDTNTIVQLPTDTTQPSHHSLLESWDYYKRNKTTAHTDTKPDKKPHFLDPQFNSNTVSTTSEENQYCQEVGQEQSDTKPKEDLLTHQQRLREDPSKQSPAGKLDGGGSTIHHVKEEGEALGKGVEKEQAELSFKARNRKPLASCISTLTANKQEPGIPPRCYSERILATGHQHSPHSPPVSWRWQKQSQQGVLLSSSLPPKPRSSPRHQSSTADNSEELYSMATKLAETNLTTLDHTRSSHPEANYLDVFNSSCQSSNQLSSDGGFRDRSKDVLSFKLPMASTNNHTTSACSEASSFECIDVALESHEEVNRGAKTVPKRQIQLKRRDMVESHINENNNNRIFSATPSRPREILQRQHSTPAAFHKDSHESEPKTDLTERRQRLQKSLSLDETSSKTKMASCIITTVLSKKMQQEENIRALEVSDKATVQMKVYSTTSNKGCLISSAKDVSTEASKVNLSTCPLLSCGTSSQSPTEKTESQATCSAIEEHSISSKTQPKLIPKHSFNNIFSGLGRSEVHGGGTEITASSETEKRSPSKEVSWLTSQNPGEKLSRDSAKGKAWNSSAVISGAIGKQATVKTTPEECCTVQGGHKLHNVKTDPITSMEKQERKGECKENTQRLTVAGYLAYDLDARTVGNIQPQSSQYSPVKEQERGSAEPRPSEQSVNMGFQSQGKLKAIAPVHVVRDMRSLLKNTYSQSFKGTGEAALGTEENISGFQPATPLQISSKQEDKPQVRKVTPPLALDRIRDLALLHAAPRGCATKATSLLESHDKTPRAGFTKVNPIITAKENSCALSKSSEAQDSQTTNSQADIQGSSLKQTNWAARAVQSNEKASTETSKNRQSVDRSRLGYEKRRDSVGHQRHHLAAHSPPTASSDELDSCKSSEQAYSTIKDGYHTLGPPPRSQSAAGPPTACILAVTPTPVLPPYFCKPNPLGYQTISPHVGGVSYVQGPVLVQTPSHNQPSTANIPIPLMRSLSEEVRLLSCPTDGNTTQHNSSKQIENRESCLKMPSPDTQQCTAFIATLGAEVIRGSAGMLYPEVGGGLAQSPRQLLLDPETGRCFYVDMPQLPQRKMLFDPETCQYVEVLLPQQTLSGTVIPSPCAIPFPSLPIPAIYTPQCLPYVQVHPQVLPPPGP